VQSQEAATQEKGSHCQFHHSQRILIDILNLEERGISESKSFSTLTLILARQTGNVLWQLEGQHDCGDFKVFRKSQKQEKK
jgi:hypothetical protein